MNQSIFQVFDVGVGPSSSHTVGPMLAARNFLMELDEGNQISEINVTIYGALAFTGKGHKTDQAIVLGLMGETPYTLDSEKFNRLISKVNKTKKLKLLNKISINFDLKENIKFDFKNRLAFHSNGMTFVVKYRNGKIKKENYFSIIEKT